MKVKFKDVANLYLGCEIFSDDPDYEGFNLVLDSIDTDNTCYINIYNKDGLNIGDGFMCDSGDFKPKLKPLINITEEDAIKVCLLVLSENCDVEKLKIHSHNLNCLNYSYNGVMLQIKWTNLTPLQVKFLVSKYYDLFNLIEYDEAMLLN